jgi:hypothetical protein
LTKCETVIPFVIAAKSGLKITINVIEGEQLRTSMALRRETGSETE